MITQAQFRSGMTVRLVRYMASDRDVVEAAKVSTLGSDAPEAEVSEGFIDFLMRNRHGSAFEHAVFKFYIECPIFVAREFMRHRMASYNEESGRYKQLQPVFYTPPPMRPLVQVGKTGEYTFEKGSEGQEQMVKGHLRMVAQDAYTSYETMLSQGVAKEVARMCLPVNIFTSFYVTMNARGLCNFLSLRTKSPNSTYPSFPQEEIFMVARDMEHHFRKLMPLTHKAWDARGRVAP